MKYDDVKKDFIYFDEIYKDVGKIPDSMLKKCAYPDTINILIKEDYKFTESLLDFYYN